MTVKEQIYEIIARRMKRDINELRGDMNLKKDLGADSIDTVEIVFAIEELYGVDVPDDLAETINTIDDAVAVIVDSVA